jgi:hypothetical protein
MSRWRASRRSVGRTLAVLALALGAGSSASPAELTVFVSGGLPSSAEWARGYGGVFTISLLNLVHGEVEGARQGSHLDDTGLLSLSAKVYAGPTVGRFVPFIGLGVGVYSEALPGDDDQGTLGLFFIGAKFKLPLGVVLRAELDWVSLPAAAPVKLNGRFLFGAGIGL